MEYGEGSYIEGARQYKGRIVVEGSKFFLKGSEDYVDTYIPLEKISGLRRRGKGIEFRVRLSATRSYIAFIEGEKGELSKLVAYLVNRLALKKRFFKAEWVGEVFWR